MLMPTMVRARSCFGPEVGMEKGEKVKNCVIDRAARTAKMGNKGYRKRTSLCTMQESAVSITRAVVASARRALVLFGPEIFVAGL